MGSRPRVQRRFPRRPDGWLGRIPSRQRPLVEGPVQAESLLEGKSGEPCKFPANVVIGGAQEKFFVNPLDDLKSHTKVIARLSEINRQRAAEALKRQQELEAAENLNMTEQDEAGQQQLNDTAQDSSNMMEANSPGGMGEGDGFGDQQMDDDMDGFVNRAF